MSRPSWSHRLEAQRQKQKRQRPKPNPNKQKDPCVLRFRPRVVVVPTNQLPQPFQSTNPEHTTHWAPSGATPGPHLLDVQDREANRGPFRPGGRRPIVARLRRANGRAYGRLDSFALRFLAYLELGLSAVRAMHFASSSDRGGVDRNTPSEPTFFTERTLAAYLAVSDRTIRNWMRRGEPPSYKLGASRRIDTADVDAFLEVRREEGP